MLPKINHWKEFLDLNAHIELIAEQALDYNKFSYGVYNQYTNVFDMNGNYPIAPDRIIDLIIANELEIVIPKSIDTDGTSIFGWPGENDCSDYVFDAAHKLISLFNLNIEKFYFLNSSLSNKERYLEYQKKYKIKKPITHFLHLNVWESNLSIYQPPEYLDTDVRLKKLFISTNLGSRPHRFALIALLNYYNLLDKGYVSSPSLEDKDNKYNLRKDINNHMYWSAVILNNHSCLSNIIEKLETLESSFPLRIDDYKCRLLEQTVVDFDQNVKSKIYQARQDSLFQLITETLYTDAVGLTEKTFNSIFLGTPFLIVGSPHALKHLKKLGYKTFHPYINESYDDVINLSDRLKMVVLELKRLSELRDNDPDTFYTNYDQIKNISKYNQELIKSR
jgi:hypothetical protein